MAQRSLMPSFSQNHWICCKKRSQGWPVLAATWSWTAFGRHHNWSTAWQDWDRFVGLVVRRPPRKRKIPGSNPACAGIFFGSSHTSDSKIGTPVATLPGAWCYSVSTGTGQPGVSILWLGEVESSICNFSVWQHIKLSEQIRPWDTLACCWDVKQPTNKTLAGLKC